MEKTIKKEEKTKFIIAILFILIGASLRILPHAPNFTPIAAIAIFAGVYFSRKTALVLPLAAMLASDMFIGFYELKLMIAVYASFLLSVIIGIWLKEHKQWYTVGLGAILSSALFFFATNFAVWAFTPWYAKNLSGIVQCYIMAMPFFRSTLTGDLFYISAFFGIYELAGLVVSKIIRGKESQAKI